MKQILFNSKRRFYYCSLALALPISIFVCSCESETRDLKTSPNAEITLTNDLLAHSSPSKSEKQSKSVDFKGVSLQNEIPFVSRIEASEITASPLEDERDKPDYVKPRHIVLEFNGKYAKRREESSSPPQIAVFPIAEFRQAFAKSDDFVKQFGEQIAILQKIISEKSAKKDKLPRIPFYDGAPEILAQFKQTSFKNGRGIFYLTQYNVDYATIINNQQLQYVFQGITTDGKYYVLATFPVTLQGLPNDLSENKFGDYELPTDFLNPKNRRVNETKYKKYLLSVEQLLNSTSAEKFTPNLNEIEKTVSSLEVNWRE